MKEKRAYRHLKERANNNDIAAAFQMFKELSQENNESAQKYFYLCEKILKNSDAQLKIESLELTDFRRFKKFKIEFHKNLTVIIGDNGLGKTTIADGITKVLSWIVANIEKAGGNGKRITPSDINVDSKQYAEINASFCITNPKQYSISLSRSISGSEQRKDSQVGEIKALADLFRVINSKQEINLPVFAFYSIERSIISSSYIKEDWTSTKSESRFDAYKECLDGSGSFSNFMEWFATLENRAHAGTVVTIEQVQEFQAIEKALQELIDAKRLTYDSELWQLHEKKRLAFLPSEQDLIAQQHLDKIKSTIIHFIPAAKEIFVSRRSGKPEMKIKTDDGIVSINLLSQGQKSIIGMIADLARRLIMLNPKMENPLLGQGIVIIDEIELHLHPKWQQSIIQNLQTTFPGIQFIITTHSPQVLTTVACDNIQVIEDSEFQTIAYKPTFSPLGHESGDALAKIMGTHREPDLPLQSFIRQFEQLVRAGKEDTDDARNIFEKLSLAGYQFHDSDLKMWRFLAQRKHD